MKKNFLIILVLSLCLFILCGCERPAGDDEIIAISIQEKYLPEKIEKTNVMKFIDELGLTIHFGDGSSETIDFTKDMISDEDYNKLFSVGVHTVTIFYLDLTTQITVEVYEKVTEYLTVKVVYPDGTPVGEGVVVQWIKNAEFYRTTSTEADGTCKMVKENYEYIIRLKNLPDGYTYNPNIYKIGLESTYIEVKLIEVSQFLEGVGSKNDPITLNEGTFEVSIDQESITGMKIFVFKVYEAGTYCIESLAIEKYSENTVDPYLGFMGTSMNFSNVDYSGNQDSYININFKYEFQGEVGTTYYFFIFASMAMEFPASFYFNISH